MTATFAYPSIGPEFETRVSEIFDMSGLVFENRQVIRGKAKFEALTATLRSGGVRHGFIPVNSNLRTTAKQYLLESQWGRPCREMFTSLAEADPLVLLNLIGSGVLEPTVLTFAAETLSEIDLPDQVIPLLLELLNHESFVVREGAVYGAARHYKNHQVRLRLQHMTSDDSSAGVREAAIEALEAE